LNDAVRAGFGKALRDALTKYGMPEAQITMVLEAAG